MASNFSSTRASSTDLSEELLRQLKRNFLNWAANYIRNDAPIQETNIDIVELAKIFQAMNFKIRYQDNDLPDAPKTKGGIKIVITCMNSTNRVVLINEDVNCTCTTDDDDNRWEVVATSNSRQSLVEAGSKKYPALTPENAALIKSVMSYLGKLAVEETTSSLDSSTPKSIYRGRNSDGFINISSSENVTHRISLDHADRNNLFDLSSRYRSLDTLIAHDGSDTGLPKPGLLIKLNSKDLPSANNLTVSSLPELKTTPLDGAHENSINNLRNCLQIAQANIDEALNMIDNNKTPVQIPISGNKSSGTAKKISALKSGNRSNLPKSPSCSNIGPSNKKAVLKVPEPASAKRVVIKPTKTTMISKTTGIPALPMRKNKYDHVKSTIPKPNK